MQDGSKCHNRKPLFYLSFFFFFPSVKDVKERIINKEEKGSPL